MQLLEVDFKTQVIYIVFLVFGFGVLLSLQREER